GLEFQQNEGAPSIITFVAPAEEIRTWAGVPHKTTSFLGGFQRPLSDRFRKIISFFNEKGNVSPTAIVVAFRPGGLASKKLSLPQTDGLSVVPALTIVEVTSPNPQEPLETLAKRVVDQFSKRIAQDVEEKDADKAQDSEDVPPAPGADEAADEEI